MHASIVTARVEIDRIDDLPALYDRILPTLRAAPGWRGIYIVVDRATGDGHLVGLWDTADDAVAFDASGTFQRILADYPPGLLVGPPSRSTGEVVYSAFR